MSTSVTALPPPDPLRSRYTGWVRAHWEALADHLLDALVPYACGDFAQIRLPGRPSRAGVVSDGLEGFARSFLLAAFRVAGSRAAARGDLVERYARGLAAGTDPAHPYAWPALADCSQQLVEAASVALALHETRPWLFDRLDARVRQRVVTWLAGFVGRRTWPNNWILFQVVVEQFLANVGGPHDPAEISGGLARIEEFYRGDGWYRDGRGQDFDYYVGWAMHLYTVLWARMAGDRVALDRYRDRLRAFLGGYQYFFAANGAPVHQGRSLTYRYATVAPLWLGALCDATPLAPGTTRRIASGVLRHFVERGVPDERGLLTLGWYGPYLPCTRDYSGPGSPYWASKAFLGLLLPPNHPVWTEPEQPSPVDTGDRVVALPAAGWLLHTTRADGIVRLVNHGSDRAGHPMPDGAPDPHYVKFGYSTHTAPDTSSVPIDGHLSVLAPDGTASQRRRIERIAVDGRMACSRYRDVVAGRRVRVATACVVHGCGELRVHRVEAPPGYTVRDGGYAIAADTPPQAGTGDGWSSVCRADGLTAAVLGLHGYPDAGVARGADRNAHGTCSAVPYVWAPWHPGGVTTYVSLVILSGHPVDAATVRGSLRLDVAGDAVCLTLPDGVTLRTPAGWSQPAATRVASPRPAPR